MNDIIKSGHLSIAKQTWEPRGKRWSDYAPHCFKKPLKEFCFLSWSPQVWGVQKPSGQRRNASTRAQSHGFIKLEAETKPLRALHAIEPTGTVRGHCPGWETSSNWDSVTQQKQEFRLQFRGFNGRPLRSSWQTALINGRLQQPQWHRNQQGCKMKVYDRPKEMLSKRKRKME